VTGQTQVLAVDIGASGGKAFVCTLEGQALRLDEVHRFDNRTREDRGRLVWDVDALSEHVRASVRAASARGDRPVSVGIDTWALDYALLDVGGARIGPVYAYRDRRHAAGMDVVHARLSFDDVYAVAGIQRLPFNTIYQLAARRLDEGDRRDLDRAARIVMIPELLAGMLCGGGDAAWAAEETNASTTSLLDARTRRWSDVLCEAAGVDRALFPEPVPAGRLLARGIDVGGTRLDVVLPACHDTASAVVGVPLSSPHAAFISSGTWSLVGAQRASPVLTPKARTMNFTNEAGVGGTTRLLKNVTGLWLLQECRRAWGEDVSFEEIARAARAHAGPVASLDVDDPSFLAPTSMLAAIADYCARTRQSAPDGVGATARAILEGLALRYRDVVLELEECQDRRVDVVHVVGGGARDALLCQLTADACGRSVLAGPFEATAIGNAIVQLVAAGALASVDDGRRLVAQAWPPVRYEPRVDPAWEARVGEFDAIVGRRAASNKEAHFTSASSR